MSDAASFAAYAAALVNRFGVVHQLYNKAGVTRGSRAFLEMRPEEFEAIPAINFGGVVNGTRAFFRISSPAAQGSSSMFRASTA